MSLTFGEFTLDESRRQLLKAGQAVRLSPKSFQLLSILAHASPNAVSKADLQERLWPNTFVTEGSLATLVTELRSVLGDDARDPKFIRTLYGFGYSFDVSVRESGSAVPRTRRGFGHLTGATAFGAVAAILILATRSTVGSAPQPASDQPIRSIAVLPFDTSGADRADQHLGLGLPDLVITRLTNVHDIVVRPTSAVREFSGRHDPATIGRKLKVDAVVEGSIRTSADRVRVTVQLLNVGGDKPIWADRFDEKRGDIFTIEDSMSGKLVEALRLQLTSNEKMLLGKRFTSNADAYQDYVQARYHLEQTGARRPYADEPVRAIEFFQRAVQKDPRFAAAWAGLSRAYLDAGWYGRLPRRTAFLNAQSAAENASRLDATLSEPCTTFGDIKFFQFDFDSALQFYNRALELNARDSEALIHEGYALQALGRFDEATAFAKRLLEIDPVSTDAQWRLANVYLTSGQDDLAGKQIQVVLGMDPNYSEAHIGLIRLAINRGDYDRAIAEARSEARIPGNIRALAFLGYALARAGRGDEARQILQQLRGRDNLQAFIDAGLGDVDSMIRLLEQGINDGDPNVAARLKTEPIFLPYHSDPRFVALLHRVGFKE